MGIPSVNLIFHTHYSLDLSAKKASGYIQILSFALQKTCILKMTYLFIYLDFDAPCKLLLKLKQKY